MLNVACGEWGGWGTIAQWFDLTELSSPFSGSLKHAGGRGEEKRSHGIGINLAHSDILRLPQGGMRGSRQAGYDI